jgi:hypothetical protein
MGNSNFVSNSGEIWGVYERTAIRLNLSLGGIFGALSAPSSFPIDLFLSRTPLSEPKRMSEASHFTPLGIVFWLHSQGPDSIGQIPMLCILPPFLVAWCTMMALILDKVSSHQPFSLLLCISVQYIDRDTFTFQMILT